MAMNSQPDSQNNFKKLSDSQLDSTTKNFVRQERELTANVLHCLREVERRRLFASLGFTSLFDYAVRALNYSEDEAYRRISAMRVLKEIPEIEEKLESGTLSLTHINMAQKLFRQEETLTTQEKIEVFERLENTTKREAEKVIVSLSQTPVRPVETIKAVARETIEIRFTADAKLEAKIQRVRGLLAHQCPGISLSDLMDKVFEMAIQKLDPAQQKAREKRKSNKNKTENTDTGEARVREDSLPAPARVTAALRSPLPISLKREVWKKCNSRCQQCGSQYRLEIDHIQPIALGGSNESPNLRLLCRSCNQRSAVKTFGADLMAKHFQH